MASIYLFQSTNIKEKNLNIFYINKEILVPKRISTNYKLIKKEEKKILLRNVLIGALMKTLFKN